MKFGSLFSGIGGLDLAMEACGHDAIWQVELDPFCNRVLKTHWPDVRRYTDIREINWGTVARPELMCGGFPCQPFSIAGENRGEDDERNMWPETLRAIRELGPDYVFLENVPGLLAHEYFGTILGDLAESGYDAVWDTFTAAEVGASHRRDRLFILAYSRRREYERCGGPGAVGGASRTGAGDSAERRRVWATPSDRGEALADGRCEQEYLREPEGGRLLRPEPSRASGLVGHPEGEFGQGRTEPAGRAGQAVPGRSGATVAHATSRRDGAESRSMEGSPGTESSSGYQPTEESWRRSGFPPGPDDRDAWARVLAEMPALEPAVCRVATGVPDRTHRLKALGNAVVPAQGAYAFRVLWQRMIEDRR